ncbi:hypothetical protein PDESU_02699 [Pontiella desulfatans]|uniref:Uncharacterized protein n=1 Tax=Pontiella desulfatans TaxID=2750659 RepID=A0A6C2U2E2_PONDE|nr:hypothetical protein [Pontiella desulfatans]VGO14140.1 hypothetical protein PDESU_02699 [Pontiella desulfatans]
MNKVASIVLGLLLGALTISAVAQETNGVAKTAAPKVTAVYGVTADDYLPVQEIARQHLRPNVRRAAARPAFDLPDAFYFIGGPIFLLLLLRVLVIFLNGFEEKRKEEQRAAASQSANPE